MGSNTKEDNKPKSVSKHLKLLLQHTAKTKPGPNPVME